jgi:small-conductance mechanosensitive channel
MRHGVSFPRVEELALEIARLVGQDPYVRFQGVADVGIALTVFFTVARPGDQLQARSRFIQRFYERAVEEGMGPPSQPWAETSSAASPAPLHA